MLSVFDDVLNRDFLFQQFHAEKDHRRNDVVGKEPMPAVRNSDYQRPLIASIRAAENVVDLKTMLDDPSS